MVIGRKGTMIKRIGSAARADVERLLGARVFLDLTVHVRPQWRRDQNEIRHMGLTVEE